MKKLRQDGLGPTQNAEGYRYAKPLGPAQGFQTIHQIRLVITFLKPVKWPKDSSSVRALRDSIP
jgi:hypothetical protein